MHATGSRSIARASASGPCKRPNDGNARWFALLVGCGAALLGGCGGSDDGQAVAPAAQVAPVVIGSGTPNTISTWDATATATINQPGVAVGTPEEMLPLQAPDLATVHVAMYDAVIAIAGGYAPFLVTPASPSAGASQDAAAAAAAYNVLKGLFPSRSASYQAAYDASLAAVTDPIARAKGVAIGAEVAVAVLSARANDGRGTLLPPFVAGSGPGQFRGPALVGRTYGFVRPFAMTSATQFRAPGPQPLTSAAYAADFNETASLGAINSTTRTPAQGVSALFQTEAPATFWPRNLRLFMMTNRSLADHARLSALLYVTQADAVTACFESKYHYLAWRPFSAINFADTDGNAATALDATWIPFMPTPPHPEYPAAHGCVSAAAAESIRSFFGTKEVSFDFTSTTSGTTHHFATTDELPADSLIARIAGGMHFRSSAVDGQTLGRNVAAYAVQTRFQKR